MKKTIGSKGISLIECINPRLTKYRVRFALAEYVDKELIQENFNSSLATIQFQSDAIINHYKPIVFNVLEPVKYEYKKNLLKEYEDLLKYTKQYQQYRAIYVNPFVLAMPQETLMGNTVQTKVLNAQNYDISVKSLGVGELIGTGSSTSVKGDPNDPNLKCEWKPDLNRIMMYRTDGKMTKATDMEFCSYTLKDKATGISSAGILKAAFNNIAPIAKSDEYWISPENNLTVTVNPLENDSDDGDGPLPSGKSAFYQDKEGKEIPIRIVKIPAGVSLNAERQGPCPDTYQRETCYGGKLTFSVRNNLSQADYSMQYTIFDADEKMSETATILLRNTVKNANTSSSGGGSFGIWGLFGLLGLVAYRRLRK